MTEICAGRISTGCRGSSMPYLSVRAREFHWAVGADSWQDWLGFGFGGRFSSWGLGGGFMLVLVEEETDLDGRAEEGGEEGEEDTCFVFLPNGHTLKKSRESVIIDRRS